MRLCRLSELRAVQIRIEPVLRQQLIVRTLLDDVAVLHDQDHIRIADGGKAYLFNPSIFSLAVA